MLKLKQSIRILGVDPGTSAIGYGLIASDGQSCRVITYGLCPAPAAAGIERQLAVYDFFTHLLKRHRPDQVALEKLFFFKNQKTVMAVSEVRGVLRLAAAKCDRPVREFTPLEVKQAVSGYGRAEKTQVQRMVKLILGLPALPQPDDAADALALAICCANTIVYEPK